MSVSRSSTAAVLVSCATLAIAAAGEQQRAPKTAAAGVPKTAASAAPAPVHGYSVVRSYPHDPEAFTQGLEYVDGMLYESTGLNGRSGIRKVNLETGAVLQTQPLDAAYFGEGITVWKNRIVQLTWQSGLGFVYDRQTLQRQRSFKYSGEGWGLTHDGTRLIMSDGSDTGTLRLLDPETLQQAGTIVVKDGGRPVASLNELEYVKGDILANVWQTERIAVIAPSSGRVTAWIDLHGLLDARQAPADGVLNGIAYDARGDRLFVTGKLWPRIFEIKIVRR
jgi:glutaminyl-peptide cyclotransferase